jgi:hypothetical protein
MGALSQAVYLGDWLKWEEENKYCREEVTVMAAASLPSGQVLGTESTFTTKHVPYDNSNAAAAAGILIEPITVETAVAVTNIVDAANLSTATFSAPHGLSVGDMIKVSGATTDTDMNANAVVASVPTATTITWVSASVTDTTYTDATLRVTKLSHQAVALVRGPALVNFNNVNWGTTDASGITAGIADLKALGIISQEGA